MTASFLLDARMGSSGHNLEPPLLWLLIAFLRPVPSGAGFFSFNGLIPYIFFISKPRDCHPNGIGSVEPRLL
jgi:hypothetical protein